MRLVYIHKSLNAKPDWDGVIPAQETENPLMTVDFATDGHPLFLQALLDNKVVSEVLVIIESARSPGTLKIGSINCLVIPSLKALKSILRPSDVLYWRGGYHWWLPILEELKGRFWNIYYGAGTPRGHWPYWDVILTDSHEKCFTKRGKLFINWNKPINTDIFKYTKGYTSQPYDVMTSPGKLFDLKQQFRTIDAMEAYTKRYGKVLSVVMPGAYRSSTNTTRVWRKLQAEKIPVYRPGYVGRPELAALLSKTKLMTHHASGLNDRCVLEAMAAGVPILSISEGGGRYPPWVKRVRRLAEGSDPDTLAQAIHSTLNDLPSRQSIADAFTKHNSIEVGVENLARLIPLFSKLNPSTDRKKMIQEYL